MGVEVAVLKDLSIVKFDIWWLSFFSGYPIFEKLRLDRIFNFRSFEGLLKFFWEGRPFIFPNKSKSEIPGQFYSGLEADWYEKVIPLWSNKGRVWNRFVDHSGFFSFLKILVSNVCGLYEVWIGCFFFSLGVWVYYFGYVCVNRRFFVKNWSVLLFDVGVGSIFSILICRCLLNQIVYFRKRGGDFFVLTFFSNCAFFFKLVFNALFDLFGLVSFEGFGLIFLPAVSGRLDARWHNIIPIIFSAIAFFL